MVYACSQSIGYVFTERETVRQRSDAQFFIYIYIYFINIVFSLLTKHYKNKII